MIQHLLWPKYRIYFVFIVICITSVVVFTVNQLFVCCNPPGDLSKAETLRLALGGATVQMQTN